MLCYAIVLVSLPRLAGAELAKGKTMLLWPIHLNLLPFSSPSAPSLEPATLGDELTDIALAGFKDYVSEILPKELQIDEQLSKQYNSSDHSRVNVAFLRWQKRVFADLHNISVEELTSRGDWAPHLQAVRYDWPQLYQSAGFKKLKTRISELSRVYLKRSGYKQLPKQFRIFIWVEVFQTGDAMRPWVRTDGAYLTGRYFSSFEKGSLKLNFEDPRGINPPYGKTNSIAPYEGMMALFPAWVSQFITPNMRSQTAVSFNFLVYAADGNTLNWEEDLTAKIEVVKDLAIKLGSESVRPGK